MGLLSHTATVAAGGATNESQQNNHEFLKKSSNTRSSILSITRFDAAKTTTNAHDIESIDFKK